MSRNGMSRCFASSTAVNPIRKTSSPSNYMNCSSDRQMELRGMLWFSLGLAEIRCMLIDPFSLYMTDVIDQSNDDLLWRISNSELLLLLFGGICFFTSRHSYDVAGVIP